MRIPSVARINLSRLLVLALVSACTPISLLAFAQEPGKPASGQPKDKPAAKSPQGADQDLDKLLEDIAGPREDAPRTKAERPKPGIPGMPGDKPPAPRTPPDDPSARKLAEPDKKLDLELERLLGRRRRTPPKDGQAGQGGQPQPGEGQGQDEEDSPLGKTIKKMREVEKRLGQRDTGSDTRKRQEDIVKDLDQLIAQARRAMAKSQGQGKTQRETQQAGNQPGSQPGQQEGASNTGAGVGASRPKTPTNVRGNLPPALRQEMENIFREEPLPTRSDRISRYYEAINRKSSQPR
jgi:hypothetical protein